MSAREFPRPREILRIRSLWTAQGAGRWNWTDGRRLALCGAEALMARITGWLGTSAALAVAITLGASSRRVTAQQAEPAASQFVGSELFRSYCVACHGKAGLGDG